MNVCPTCHRIHPSDAVRMPRNAKTADIRTTLGAMILTVSDRGGFYLPPLAILTIVLYTLGYFVRLAVMTKVSKNGEPASIRKYFVEGLTMGAVK